MEEVMRSLAVSVFAAVALVALCAPYAAQAEPPLDRGAVHKTRVPLLGSSGIKPSVKNGGGGGGTSTVLPANFALTAYTVGTVVPATTTSPEAEEEIAVDPNNYQNLFAAISDFSNFQNITKYVYSSTDGSTWVDENFLPISGTGFLVTADGQNWSANSDPTTGIDRSGKLYLCNLYIAIDATTGNVLYSGLYVGATGGLPYSQAQIHPVFPVDTSGRSQPDKPWMAVDNTTGKTNSGHIYVTWSEFKTTRRGSTDMIDFAASTTQGATWSAPKQVSLSTQNGAVQGSQVAVGPDGTVYVVYEVFYAGNQRAQFLTKSINGGSTFTTPVAITPKFNELNIGSLYRTNSFASIAAGSTVNVVYSAQPGTTAQIEFMHSTTNGFSAPVVINDVSAGDHFFPSVAVDSNGVIHTSWFDTRNSPSNPEFYDVYATYTKDGSTFAANAKVTPTIIDSGTGSIFGQFIGDYAGIAAAVNGSISEAHPVWTNGGFGDFPFPPGLGFAAPGQLQTSKLTVP
jgi:hypothetical protein